MCLSLSLGALSFSGCPRSLIRLPAHFLAGGRRARGEDRESRSLDGHRVPDHAFDHTSSISLFLQEPTTSAFQFLVYLCLSPFFSLFYLSISLIKPFSIRMSKKMKQMKPKAVKWFSLKKKRERERLEGKSSILKRQCDLRIWLVNIM